MGITVLSLFDGISCGQIALERAGIEVDTYYASEIKKHAIETTLKHYPETVEIGDVRKVWYNDGTLYTEKGNFKVGEIDLLIGGSPCQNFSIARVSMGTKKMEGLNGDKSSLFYEYLRLKRMVAPRYFLLENVRMKKDSENELNSYMGVEGIHINSKLVSFQLRERIYWSNIKGITLPEDKKVSFQEHKDTDSEYCKLFKVKRTPSRERMWNWGKGRETSGNCTNITNAEKVGCITRKQDRCPNSGLIEFEDFCRYLTRREIEKAQTLPVGYTDNLTYGQMQDVCGDGWTVDVIAHIFKFLKRNLENEGA